MAKAQKLPAGVIISGGGAKSQGILDLARDEIKMPAQIGFPNLSEFEASHAQITNELDDPEMAVACGSGASKSGHSCAKEAFWIFGWNRIFY